MTGQASVEYGVRASSAMTISARSVRFCGASQDWSWLTVSSRASRAPRREEGSSCVKVCREAVSWGAGWFMAAAWHL